MVFERIARGIACVVAGLGLAMAGHALAEKPAPLAPPLVASLLDGGTLDLAAERGHVVVLHFWASWCQPCRAEMPLLDRYARAHRKVWVVALSFDTRRDLPKVRAAMQAMAFPTALAAGARRNGFGEGPDLPQTLVIDAAGHIRARFAGGRPALTEAALSAAVSAAGEAGL